jgi:hypothetical protein
MNAELYQLGELKKKVPFYFFFHQAKFKHLQGELIVSLVFDELKKINYFQQPVAPK